MLDALDRIDLADPDNYVERIPFDWFDTLRREHPVVWHPERPPNHGFWAVTRHDDLTAVHMDWETFSSQGGGGGPGGRARGVEEAGAEEHENPHPEARARPAAPHGDAQDLLEALQRPGGRRVRGL